MHTPTAPTGAQPTVVGRSRRMLFALERCRVAALTAVTSVVAGIRDAIRRPTASQAVEPTVERSGAGSPEMQMERVDERPRWATVAIATAIAAGVLALRIGPSTSLYWYVFPLFGLGVAYVLQFRSELTARWWAVLVGAAVLGALGVARDWAFSGHVLWNVLFLGHAAQLRIRRTWILVLLASLVHLIVMKVAFQRPKDVVGGFVSVAIALAALPLAGARRAPTAT